MLLITNRFDKSDSKYQCDMCKNKTSAKDRMVISIAKNYENSKKKWDLCPKCYKKVERAVENWHKKEGEQKK